MTSPAVIVWSQFVVCVALIGVAGTVLSRYGDVIAEKTGLGGTWIGLVLLATVTSLPELVTGISSVTVADTPDIALGDVLGSCVFNLAIITILDFLQRGESVYTRASQGHILAAGFGVILIGFVGFNVLLADRTSDLAIGHLGIYTPLIVILYVVAMRTVFRYERAQMAAYVGEHAERYPDIRLRQAVGRYVLAALVVVGAGIWLPFIGAQIARVMGWEATFVGTLFVAFATSVPEMVVTIAAMRLGALDMAIGNLLGSNLFDILIVAVDDLFFLRGPILAHVSPMHAVSAISAMMMTGIVIVGLLYQPRSRLFGTVGWASMFLLTVYLLNSLVLYLYGGSAP
ncbi:MAG: cation transporter [Candidatus Muproteobacteria bacterium RIFCSPHIGHO2_01_FULL_65_16]|uniref:Cation transporter n=1 Tax=Candidatus Muproteobacteria bacterium RIFCSPHIGHO2_01_FULL_65_16 TaxID=1817764 RepID=A0A1F6TJN2_9PROT|nr:MAG: cation transporter [Candidatus Muproteobacteria bacterium RIFCSPHIGHO2_01_FULL_65_16]